jgi:glucokinase
MILAGDIGGTKVNLAAFEVREGRLVQLATETFPSREHSSLEEIAGGFLAKNRITVRYASFGIAGPVKNGRSLLTNLRWTIDARNVSQVLGGAKVWLMNDLQATAHGIATLPAGDFLTLNEGQPVPDGNWAIIAAGTGLGEAGMVWSGARQVSVGSEGGNTDFSPRTELDIELLRYLQKQFGEAIWEYVLSGQGLYNIYKFLWDSGRGDEPAWLAEEVRRDEKAAPAVISRNALEQKSPLCEAALDLFVGYYGAETMNLALKLLATGGVFIGGGIAPKIAAKLQDGTFMRAFLGEHRYRELLEAMPVKIILNDKAALLGAARFAALEAGMPA